MANDTDYGLANSVWTSDLGRAHRLADAMVSGNSWINAHNLTAKANQTPGFVGVFSMFRANTPQLYIDVDRTKCKRMGVPLSEVFNALQIYLGSYYVNDFKRFGRTWQVNLQADAGFRKRARDVRQLKIRNARGDMLPIGAVATVEDVSGPVMITRYNMYPSAAINGSTAPGVGSGQAIAMMDDLAERELPPSMTTEWTELTYMRILAGNTAIFIFPLCVLFVFLTHSAEYEAGCCPWRSS